MNDKEFLQWIWDRLKFQHGENPNVDYMRNFKRIIEDKAIIEEMRLEDTPKYKEIRLKQLKRKYFIGGLLTGITLTILLYQFG